MKKQFRSMLMASLVMLVTMLWAQDVATLQKQADQAMAAENWAKAEQILNKIIATDAGNGPANYALSVVAIKRDNLKTAQQSVAKALEADPRNAEYRAQVDVVTEISSGMKQGQQAYNTRDYDEAISRYEQIAEKYPTFATAHYYMGLAYRAAGNLRQAAASFRKASNVNKENSNYAKALQKLVGDKLNEGNRFFRAKDYDSAIQAYTEALDLDRNIFPRAFYLLAIAQKNIGDTQAALKTLDEGLAVHPRYVQLYVTKGDILSSEGSVDEAEKIFRQAIALDARSDDAWVGLGKVLSVDDNDAAIHAFEQAISIDAKNRVANEHLGELYSEKEQWDQAREHLETASKLNQKSYATWWRLAVAYNNLGQIDKARDAARRSTNLNANFEYGWFELGNAEKALGNKFAAIEAYNKAKNGRDATIRKAADYEINQLQSPNR